MCRIYFSENRFHDETLYVYYIIDEFYQNERRYEKSKDLDQLLGSHNGDYLSSDCEPFRYYKLNDNLLKYAPCGGDLLISLYSTKII
jgi:hypothetical protein